MGMKEDKILKKLISFLLCAVMVGCLLVSCVDKVDPGAELNLYMEMPTNFDPATAYNDQAAAQFLPLVYQGLFTIDEKGKLQKAMCNKYTVKDNVIEFTINETCWSDGIAVSATDFVYAWKRILDPEFQSEAASLLFYIENAVEVKNGDKTIDDLHLYAAGDKLIRVELIDASYVDQFLNNCASIALYPVRENAVGKLNLHQLYYDTQDVNGKPLTSDTQKPVLFSNEVLTDYSWSTISTILVSCGPFYVKRTNFYPESGSKTLVLERNKYYYRDTSELGDDALRKYVDPYRLNIELVSPDEALTAYNEGTAITEFNELSMIFNNNLPLEARSTSDSLKDLFATYTYFFNTDNPQFASADVRKALSGVLDRNEIVNISKYGKAATGLINDLVLYGNTKDSFRSKAGNAIGSTLSESEAKSLIAGAGVTPGEITLTVRKNETEQAVANYVKDKWEALGYTVTIEALGTSSASYADVVGTNKDKTAFDVQYVYEGLTRDRFVEKYQSGEFDVIGVQYNMLSTDPFVALAPFAPRYSGNAYDFTVSSDEFELVKGITGYDSEAFNALIDRCVTTGENAPKDTAARADLLIQAEKQLLDDAVVAPLYFMQSGAKMRDNLTGLVYRYDGIADFTKASDEGYVYAPEAVILPSKVWG